MKLIGITGKAGSGKDTVAARLVRDGYQQLSWAGPLKAGLAAMGFPEPANRDDKEAIIPGFDFSWREAAQRLGTEWGRAMDPDIWVKMMEREILRRSQVNGHPIGGRFVISDVRFENEAAMIRRMGGTMLFLHGRQAELGGHAAHASEAGIQFYSTTDHVIDNSQDLNWTMSQVHYALRGRA